MLWIWDEHKEKRNIHSHGISFKTAEQVFDDPFSMTKADPYWDEPRWRTIGMIDTVIVVVIHTMPELEEYIKRPGRIINARKATKFERRIYENKKR